MQVILIDTSIVPEESSEPLIAAARKSAGYLRTLPGFVEGYIFEKAAMEFQR